MRFRIFLGVEGGNRMDIEIDFVASVESEVHAIAEGDTVRQGLHEQFAAQGLRIDRDAARRADHA